MTSSNRRQPEDTQTETGRQQPSVLNRIGLRNIIASTIILLCIVGIAWLRSQAEATDFAVVNIASFVLFMIALITFLVRLATSRRLPRSARWAPLIVVLLAAVAVAAVTRIDRVDGRLVPVFRFRWTPKPDQLLEAPLVAEGLGNVDISKSTAAAFPQFLGPNRNLIIDDVRLDRDWQNAPPREIWRQPIGAGWSGFSAVNGFAFTMEQRGPQELITCYEVETGKARWSHGIETRHETVMGGVGPRCTPTIHDGRVYGLGATGVLRCLDGATGELLWSDDILARYGVTPEEDLNAVAWGRAASPLIVDNMVVVPFGGPAAGPFYSLAAYDAESGELRWKGGDVQVSYSSPVLTTLAGTRQIVIVNESTVSGHVPETGDVLWSHPWNGSSTASASVSQAVPLPGDRILLSKGYGQGAELIRIDATPDSACKATSLWQSTRVLKTKFTNVVALAEHVYGLSDGILECVQLSDGRRLWKDRRRADFEHGQLLCVGDVLLAQAEKGDVVMFQPNPSEYHELGRFTALHDQTWNNLCLYGKYLLVRNAVEAACFELPLLEVPSDDSAAGEETAENE